jgi:hypothetical protein
MHISVGTADLGGLSLWQPAQSMPFAWWRSARNFFSSAAPEFDPGHPINAQASNIKTTQRPINWNFLFIFLLFGDGREQHHLLFSRPVS